MMAFLRRMLHLEQQTTSGNVAATRALAESDALIKKMRETSGSNDAWRAVLADIFLQRHNVPYMTTVYESTQEMNAAAHLADRTAHNDNGKS